MKLRTYGERNIKTEKNTIEVESEVEFEEYFKKLRLENQFQNLQGTVSPKTEGHEGACKEAQVSDFQLLN